MYGLLGWRFTAFKKKKDKLEAEMDALGSLRDLQIKESEITERISGLEKKIHFSKKEEVK